MLGGAVALRNGKDVTTVGSAPRCAAPPDSVSDTFANSAKESAAVGRRDVVSVFFWQLIIMLYVFSSDPAGFLLWLHSHSDRVLESFYDIATRISLCFQKCTGKPLPLGSSQAAGPSRCDIALAFVSIFAPQQPSTVSQAESPSPCGSLRRGVPSFGRTFDVCPRYLNVLRKGVQTRLVFQFGFDSILLTTLLIFYWRFCAHSEDPIMILRTYY